MFESLFQLFTFDIGIDLGTANTRVGIKGKGVVLFEPSVVAINKATKEVLAVGKEAKEMLGRTPASVVALRPLKDGIIVDFDTTLAMLKYFINKVHQENSTYSTVPRPRVVIGVPSSITEVEKQAVIDAAEAAGAREAYVIEEPMAAAIGVGIPVNEPMGNLVVDIGGGTTDIAIISLGGIVVDKTIPIAGDEMDEQIVDFLKERYGILIGKRSAEKIKITVGSAIPLKKEKFVAIQGRDLLKGLPRSVEIGSNDVVEAVAPSLHAMTEAIKQAIEDAPPELVSDIFTQGMLLTGGGGKLEGLDKYWEEALHIKVKRPADPSYSVVLGTLEALNHLDVLKRLKEAERSLL
ncbi:rod shape-determining protein [Candidatus Dojkabacteria bacterium CG_4_9_14_3_um_filter_150_Dojkabacteria_WS6_41_13]|uniref:Cell shape-determining protein MreB n=1 Tax=Candidatus Dojkabacteria bacterium CG_4_10_14_0_2_um_filter_Dojkabacteria_WS6_41_15 TaxID=2014249 RepID=A0A2M7W1U9_9BACT|nr:MAG: rod shape-determining protein [Candidatus Dojkabacteria bacterium CG_4_10_14_3_um_filter_Dojkabacteria_WS6_41_9]PJA13664.1 MAG: rod shape-determining protein [Candidatus Dojkabacteria bacterium CG_4_10_14_0_2_um_filter_Dojkabacteria_WS6_41_15]PJB23118.1 MAG: rod shape-determining protein [Candidatus Dojkabacteria bacterium CG_4_9_14_3_um_filter_150_Dojkabacteria_WS6_41_13]